MNSRKWKIMSIMAAMATSFGIDTSIHQFQHQNDKKKRVQSKEDREEKLRKAQEKRDRKAARRNK